MIEITYNNQFILESLEMMAARVGGEAMMRSVGEVVTDITKQAFVNSASPDGTPWEKNSPVTVLRYLNVTGGNFKKDGSLTKKGQARLTNKKPLIGQSGDLARQFSYTVSGDTVAVQNSMVYAAMHQFGGTKARFPHLWGDIPARPFFPIYGDFERLMPQAEREVAQVMSDYMEELIKEMDG